MVEVAKALSVEERTERRAGVVLDEPTSVLDGEETEVLFAQIERLRQASVVFVSHRLDEVLRVSDRVYVLQERRCVAERYAGRSTCELHRLMVGRDLSGVTTREEEQVSARAR